MTEFIRFYNQARPRFAFMRGCFARAADPDDIVDLHLNVHHEEERVA